MLGVIAAVAPMVGLLGTVVGMILAFRVTSQAGTGKAELLAEGIYLALLRTAFGLLIAVPAMLLPIGSTPGSIATCARWSTCCKRRFPPSPAWSGRPNRANGHPNHRTTEPRENPFESVTNARLSRKERGAGETAMRVPVPKPKPKGST